MTTFLFAGGGTGGHIFPALAIHEQLQELAGNCSSIFVCSDRPLDAQILEAEGLRHQILPARPFGLRPVPLVKFIWTWGNSLRTARRIIRLARESGKNGMQDVHVVAMGGFIAAPMARAAMVEGVPLTLINMDAIPGRANRWTAAMAKQVLTSAPVSHGGRRYAMWQQIAPIVRRSAVADQPASECRAELGLDPARPTLLVTGASQGARSINRLMARLVRDRVELLRGWQVIHQTGREEDEAMREVYASANPPLPALVAPFFSEMGLLWGAADLALSRAGAGSVAEAWANHTPAVFLPYPYHKDEHQRHNALPLEKAGGAVIVRDRVDEARNLQGDGSPGEELARLIRDGHRREEMKRALEALGPADGARHAAKLLLQSVK